MIKEMVNDKANAAKRCNEAYEKAQEYQEKLNDVITFVDPTEQLSHLVEDGKMAGVPIALKDNACTKDIRTTAGSKILSNYVPFYSATVAKKLEEAGAVCIAKASMDELAMGGTNLTSYTGPCHNPYDTSRMAGGSSGGSAALVASGVVPMATGSDTGDSIRKPASYCGIVGVKPTYGRISRYGVVPYASSLDHVGYFTRSIEDAALTLEVLAGRDDLDMTSSKAPVEEYSKLLNSDLKGRKIAVLGNVMDAITNKETVALFNDLMKKLEEKGAEITTYYFDENLIKAILPTYYIIANCEATSNHSNLDGIRFGVREDGASMEEIMTNSRTKGFGPTVRKRFVIGSYALNENNQDRLFRKAQKVRRLIVEDLKKCLSDADCVIAPASGGIAPKIDGQSDALDAMSDEVLIVENHMVIGNFSGYPSMTVPMGFEDGMPIGVNLTCKAFDEVTMFNIGLAIEETTGLKDIKAEVK